MASPPTAAFPSGFEPQRGPTAPDMRNPSPPDLQEMGISPEDWMRLPGELRSDLLQAGTDDASPEYRALIKRYFRALARQGAVQPAEPDEEEGE